MFLLKEVKDKECFQNCFKANFSCKDCEVDTEKCEDKVALKSLSDTYNYCSSALYLCDYCGYLMDCGFGKNPETRLHGEVRRIDGHPDENTKVIDRWKYRACWLAKYNCIRCKENECPVKEHLGVHLK
jgi:hypothetical protein